MKSMLRTTALIFGTFSLALFCALQVFLNAASDGALYYRIQTAENVLPGVDCKTMRDLDTLLGEYLSGEADALDGAMLFNADEKAHMADVYALFSLARSVKAVAGALSIALLAAIFWKRALYTRRQLLLGVIGGAALFFLPFAALGVWAALDFSAAFTAMHRALFSNGLWLMDPSSDLMIRMLPERFFVSLGKYLAVRCAAAAVAAALLAAFIMTFSRKKLCVRLARWRHRLQRLW